MVGILYKNRHCIWNYCNSHQQSSDMMSDCAVCTEIWYVPLKRQGLHFDEIFLIDLHWKRSHVDNSGRFRHILDAHAIKIWGLTSIGNPIAEIRRKYDRLHSTVGFPILIKLHFLLNQAPCVHLCHRGHVGINLGLASVFDGIHWHTPQYTLGLFMMLIDHCYCCFMLQTETNKTADMYTGVNLSQ